MFFADYTKPTLLGIFLLFVVFSVLFAEAARRREEKRTAGLSGISCLQMASIALGLVVLFVTITFAGCAIKL